MHEHGLFLVVKGPTARELGKHYRRKEQGDHREEDMAAGGM